jgi:hypothetical protein
MKPSCPENDLDGFTTDTVACLCCNIVSITDTDQFHHRHCQFHLSYRVLNFGARRGPPAKPLSNVIGYFVADSDAQGPAFGWTVPELLDRHPVPERPEANYHRLRRVDGMGLVWLLQGRPVVALTATEAIMRCGSGATLKFYRRTEPAPAIVTAGTTANAKQTPTPMSEQIVDHIPETRATP